MPKDNRAERDDDEVREKEQLAGRSIRAIRRSCQNLEHFFFQVKIQYPSNRPSYVASTYSDIGSNVGTIQRETDWRGLIFSVGNITGNFSVC